MFVNSISLSASGGGVPLKQHGFTNSIIGMQMIMKMRRMAPI
jgi:hypothetical protein